MWITSYWNKPLTRDGSSPYILQPSNSCRFPQDTHTCIWRSCLVRSMCIFQGIHAVLHLKLLVPTNPHVTLKILVHPLNMAYPQDTYLWRSCLVRSTCIFLGIHVGLNLKLLELTNHMSLSRSWCILSKCRILKTYHRLCLSRPHCLVRPVFLNLRAAARYQALASIIPDRERPEETTICYKISLVHLITDLNATFYMSTCHTVYISVLILSMIMP